MQKVLTAEQMREVDRLTTERYGIPSILLMENAAHAVARVITKKLGGSVKGKSVLILCGKGNNGGDGAALARILYEAGAVLQVYLFGKLDETKGDARENFKKLLPISSIDPNRKGSLYFEEIPTIDYWVHSIGLGPDDFDVLVDALFGTGLTRPLGIIFRYVPLVFRQERRNLGKTGLIVSIDVPSGLNSDSFVEPEIVIGADLTVTFTAPKVANVLPPARRFNGQLTVADIGSPVELIQEQSSQFYLSESRDAEVWLEKTPFTDDSYKNKRGHALIVAGSEDYSGAAVMCGNAAMRSGVGLTTLLVPASCNVEVASRIIPEVIVRAIGETGGEVSSDAFAANEDVIEKADSILVGPGLTATDKGVEKFVREIVESGKVPVIVDAGALWLFSPFKADDVQPPANAGGSALILTPHEGEFLRLLGTTDKDAIKDRVAAVRDFAVRNNVILVLKGERVLIGSPDGRVVVNPTGNSGLGKAGNGDTLAGILAGFVAQAVKFKIDIFETVVAAVYVAGMAGDVAEKKYGKRVMTASDVRECLVDVFAEFEKKE
jgi:hydroxyethylthiazole kinase-like uncharacterized protein yjeF